MIKYNTNKISSQNANFAQDVNFLKVTKCHHGELLGTQENENETIQPL